MNKTFRQGQILKLIRAKSILTQEDLARELKESQGIRTTQVTLSRDIRELGLVKTAEGYREITALEEPADADEARRAVQEFLTDVRQAQNLLVLKTDPGNASSLAVSARGRITGSYSNGQTIDIAAITLASFSGESFLLGVTGGAYAQTDASGVPVYNASGSITPSSLEGSNTDIADQFTKLIVTQQAYSANAKVITSSNQMLQVVMNMVQ